MNGRRSQQGFVHLGFVLFMIVCLAVGGVFLYVKHARSVRSANSSSPTKPACKVTEGIKMCLLSSESRVASSDTTELTTVISNSTNNGITQTFSCTFTDPSIFLNGHDLSLGVVCGQAITNKSIGAQSSESFLYELSGSKLKSGSNTVKAKWGSYESGELVLQKANVEGKELASQFKTCQALKDKVESDDVPGYCAGISVVLKDSASGQYSCQAWKDLFKKIGLAVPCTSVMDIGVGYIYVPRDDSGQYLQKIRSLPEVSSASVESR